MCFHEISVGPSGIRKVFPLAFVFSRTGRKLEGALAIVTTEEGEQEFACDSTVASPDLRVKTGPLRAP